jgi:hypothetical protein
MTVNPKPQPPSGEFTWKRNSRGRSDAGEGSPSNAELTGGKIQTESGCGREGAPPPVGFGLLRVLRDTPCGVGRGHLGNLPGCAWDANYFPEYQPLVAMQVNE